MSDNESFGDDALQLEELSLVAGDVPAMVRFYDAVFETGFEPYAAFGTTFYRGVLHGVRFVIAPNAIASVEASQNRHQFVYATPDLEGLLARAVEAGGTVRDTTGSAATVLDPDGNTIVFHSD